MKCLSSRVRSLAGFGSLLHCRIPKSQMQNSFSPRNRKEGCGFQMDVEVRGTIAKMAAGARNAEYVQMPELSSDSNGLLMAKCGRLL